MGLRIDPSVSALAPRRQATQTANRLGQTLGRLAAGQRIARAADDAAGLAIAERFQTEVRQFNVEMGNFQSGINFLDTAGGGLELQQEGVSRLGELALQAANGTLNADQRAALNNEAQQILDQIGAIGAETEFNGLQTLDGSAGQVALDAGGNVEINVGESSINSLGLTGVDLTTQANASSALTAIDTATTRLSQERANVGAQQNRLEATIAQRETAALNSQASEAQLRDLDIARATIERTRDEILLQSSVRALARSGIQSQNAARLLGV